VTLVCPVVDSVPAMLTEIGVEPTKSEHMASLLPRVQIVPKEALLQQLSCAHEADVGLTKSPWAARVVAATALAGRSMDGGLRCQFTRTKRCLGGVPDANARCRDGGWVLQPP
jgi:hypothetical protein